MAIEVIDSVVNSWRRSGASDLNPGAAISQLRAAERTLCRPLPDEFCHLYKHCNGGDILGGNIQLYPLDGDELSVVRASDYLRSNGWQIPPELVVFAGNGQGEQFGLWFRGGEADVPFVIEVGQIFKGGSFSVTGTSLSGFLRGHSAYYLLLLECNRSSLEALNLPIELKRASNELIEQDYDILLRWANPDLPPELPLSCYDARLTADAIRRLPQFAF